MCGITGYSNKLIAELHPSIYATFIVPNVKFNYTIEEIDNIVINVKNETEKVYEELSLIPIPNCTFETFLQKLIELDSRTNDKIKSIAMLKNLSSDPEIRKKAIMVEDDIFEFNSKMATNLHMFNRMKFIYDQMIGDNDDNDDENEKSSTVSKYQAEKEQLQKKVVKIYMRNFRGWGMHLRAPRKKLLLDLLNEEKKLEQTFDQNISNNKSFLNFTKEELTGLNENFLETNIDKERPNLYKITTDCPVYTPILDYCDNENTRKKVLEMVHNSVKENVDVLVKLHDKRRKIAEVLGFSNNAELNLSTEMCDSSEKVYRFISQVLGNLDHPTKTYMETLRNFKYEQMQIYNNNVNPLTNRITLPETRKRKRDIGTIIHAYDYEYYHNKYIKSYYNLDTDKLRDYFTLDNTIKTMLELFAELFSLEIVQVKDFRSEGIPEPWNYDRNNDNDNDNNNSNNGIYVYAIYAVDANNILRMNRKQLYGYCYMDLFPRDGKYKYFCMDELAGGYYDFIHRRQIIPLVSLICNFTASSSSTPSLLSMEEVSTLFHEFGHVLHGICGGFKAKYQVLGGTKTETDFVEAPSQMLEQWVMEPKILKRIGKHYKNGNILPDSIIGRIQQTKTVGSSCVWSKISARSLIDNLIWTSTHINKRQLLSLYETIMNSALHHDTGSGNRLGQWVHLAGGYDAKYYSYVWTMVIACDLYSRFRSDPLNKSIGIEYRKKILEPGGSLTGNEMVNNFLGRDVSVKSFLQYLIGLEPHHINAKNNIF